MKLFTLLIACSFLGIAAHAQHDEQIMTPAGKPSAAARFGEGITASAVKQQLAIVAGAGMQGRETATEGQRKAAAYIISQFSKAGLQPGANGKWEQYFYLYQDTVASGTISFGGTTYTFGQDYYSGVQNGSNQELKTSRVVFAGYGISEKEYDNYEGLDVDGEVVMILPGEPHTGDTTYQLTGNRRPSSWSAINKKVAEAANRKAAAILVVTEGVERIEKISGKRLFRSGIYTTPPKPATTPNIYYISADMAAAILGVKTPEQLFKPAAADRLKPTVVKKPISISFKKGVRELRSSNVLAYLEGTDKKDEVVFVTAHYDHLGTQDSLVYYGADDDGSGTVSVIEIANAFARAKQAGQGPRRSMVFMTVSGEEKGLLGSKYYTENPVYPLDKTVVDLNIDMVGRVDPMHENDTNYVYVIGDDKLSSALRTISEKANAAYTKFHLDYKYNDPEDPNRFYYRSDHYMFARNNIPVIFYFNGTHEDYHRVTDTVEKIDYSLLSRRAQLVFYTAWEIANRDERLKVDRHEK